jgi:hypothetical protein
MFLFGWDTAEFGGWGLVSFCGSVLAAGLLRLWHLCVQVTVPLQHCGQGQNPHSPGSQFGDNHLGQDRAWHFAWLSLTIGLTLRPGSSLSEREDTHLPEIWGGIKDTVGEVALEGTSYAWCAAGRHSSGSLSSGHCQSSALYPCPLGGSLSTGASPAWNGGLGLWDV